MEALKGDERIEIDTGDRFTGEQATKKLLELAQVSQTDITTDIPELKADDVIFRMKWADTAFFEDSKMEDRNRELVKDWVEIIVMPNRPQHLCKNPKIKELHEPERWKGVHRSHALNTKTGRVLSEKGDLVAENVLYEYLGVENEDPVDANYNYKETLDYKKRVAELVE
jgi:hypothetical protein